MSKGWGIEWHSVNRLDGQQRHVMWEGPGRPFFFSTRRNARAFLKAKWGYIKERPDLQAEPHGWRIPQAVRIEVQAHAVRETRR